MCGAMTGAVQNDGQKSESGRSAGYHTRRLGVFVSAGALLLSVAAIPISLGLNAVKLFYQGPMVRNVVWRLLAASAISFSSFLFAHWKCDHSQRDRSRKAKPPPPAQQA